MAASCPIDANTLAPAAGFALVGDATGDRAHDVDEDARPPSSPRSIALVFGSRTS